MVALVFVKCSKSEELNKLFLKKIFNLKMIRLKSIPIMLLLPILTVVISILISTMFGYKLEQLTLSDAFSFKVGMVPTLIMLMMAACFEELGWRGYGFESICSKMNYFKASLVFGFVWSLWHFPLLFIEGTYQYHLRELGIFYVINFFVSILPLAFIIGWVGKINKASITSAILFHFIINIAQELFMLEPATKCIQSVVLCVVAVIVVLTNRALFFNQLNHQNPSKLQTFIGSDQALV